MPQTPPGELHVFLHPRVAPTATACIDRCTDGPKRWPAPWGRIARRVHRARGAKRPSSPSPPPTPPPTTTSAYHGIDVTQQLVGPGRERKGARAWAHVRKRTTRPVRTLSTSNGREDAAHLPLPVAPRSHRHHRTHRGAMTSVASSCCSFSSTFFASYAPRYQTGAPRPSLRQPPRRSARQQGRSVLRCLPNWDSDNLGNRASDEKGAEPISRGPGISRSLGASCGLAFAVVAGVLMLQGSQQALAGTQFMGLQPADVLGDLGDISTGFASAFLLIFFSELGDRTFFIAALLAARNPGAVIFLGTFGALAVMTIVSVVLGRAFHYVDGIIPFSFGGTDFPVDDFLAACLLVYYGVTTLLDAASGDAEKMNEEQEEAELAVSKFSGNGAGIMSAASTVASTFVLVFIAEWGDKSFFSTIALAAASSPLGVIAGTLAGHALATLIAVLGGSLLGTFLSEKIIAYIGGSLFLAFAAVTLVEIVS
ncbi:hypothetical protein ABZP36_015408 [Zizania latifolia]